MIHSSERKLSYVDFLIFAGCHCGFQKYCLLLAIDELTGASDDVRRLIGLSSISRAVVMLKTCFLILCAFECSCICRGWEQA